MSYLSDWALWQTDLPFPQKLLLALIAGSWTDDKTDDPYIGLSTLLKVAGFDHESIAFTHIHELQKNEYIEVIIKLADHHAHTVQLLNSVDEGTEP